MRPAIGAVKPIDHLVGIKCAAGRQPKAEGIKPPVGSRLSGPAPELQAEITVPTAAMQMAAVIAGSLPIIAVYPFIQKHFTKGMLLGAVKG